MSRRKILIFISLILFITFVYFSYLVHKNHFAQFDFNTTVKLQDHISRRFDLPFSVISLLGSAEITSVIWLIILILIAIKKRWKVLALLFLFPISQLFEVYGKSFVYHPAPPYLFYRGDIPFSFPSSYIHTNFSYPSGHSTRLTFLVIFLILVILNRYRSPKKVLLSAVLVGFLIAVYVSRVYLAEHWTTDVIGGALLGASLGIFPALPLMNKHS